MNSQEIAAIIQAANAELKQLENQLTDARYELGQARTKLERKKIPEHIFAGMRDKVLTLEQDAISKRKEIEKLKKPIICISAASKTRLQTINACSVVCCSRHKGHGDE